MILNTAFLLRKETESEFDRRVKRLDHNFCGEVCFKLIGPLPLYSFRCVEIKWADAQQVREALALLSLKEGGNLADLRRAYYQKAQSLHPDKAGYLLNSSSEFEKVVEAYKFLKMYYSHYRSFPPEERILLMEVRTNDSN